MRPAALASWMRSGVERALDPTRRARVRATPTRGSKPPIFRSTRPSFARSRPNSPTAGDMAATESASNAMNAGARRAVSTAAACSSLPELGGSRHRHQVVEDVHVEQVIGIGAPQPSRDTLAPGRRGAPPFRVRHHDASLAATHPGFVEQVLQVGAERREPRIVVFRARVHQSVVLIGGEQAFAAAAGAQHEHAPRCRSRAVSVSFESLDGDGRGASGQCAYLVRDDACGGISAQPLGRQAGGDLGKAAVRGGESGGIAGACDRVPQLGRGTRAMVKQIALGDHSERRSGGVRDAEVPDPETIHASERTIDHLVAGHRVHRRAHHR